MAAKFKIFKNKAGQYQFHLKAPNGEIIAASEAYTSKDGCMKGIESVKKNAPDGKFEVFQDKKGEYRFNLKAGNGEIIAVSEGYTSKDGCNNGIESVKKNAPIAEIVEE
jgi:uncharacterized protein YegP (UPF0339 family)